MKRPRSTVLVVDDDHDVAGLVEQILIEEGYAVTIFNDPDPDAVKSAIGHLAPDCILLDGIGNRGYGDSWDTAEWLTAHGPPIPMVMFTAHFDAVDEAARKQSPRSRAAGFAAVLLKPFDVDELLRIVDRAVGRPRPSGWPPFGHLGGPEGPWPSVSRTTYPDERS